MRCRILSAGLTVVLVIAGCNKDKGASANVPAAPVAAAVAPDLKAIAQSIVQRSLGVREGDLITVSGSPRDLELMEDVVIEVEKAGANAMPLLSTERMARMSFDEVPEKYDSVPGRWGAVINRTATGYVEIDASETPDLLSHVAPARLTARNHAGLANADLAIKRKIRVVSVGNDMYPTHARAARFGMSRDQLASFFWSALNADFSGINANAKFIKDAIGNAKELHITDPNGTDLRVGITKKTWFISDGVMTDEGVAKGDFIKYLPAGEAFTRIDPATAEGTIVEDRHSFQSKIIEKLTIKVSKGKIVSMTAPSGMEPLQKSYEAETMEGKTHLSVIDFGINPGIRVADAPNLRTYIPEGMFSINFGNDVWAGGTNNVAYGFAVFLPRATVAADGKVIVENGVIKK